MQSVPNNRLTSPAKKHCSTRHHTSGLNTNKAATVGLESCPFMVSLNATGTIKADSHLS